MGPERPGQDPPSETSLLPGDMRRSDLTSVTATNGRELKTRKKTVAVLHVQFIDNVMDVPVITQRPYDHAEAGLSNDHAEVSSSSSSCAEKTVGVTPIQFIDRVQ